MRAGHGNALRLLALTGGCQEGEEEATARWGTGEMLQEAVRDALAAGKGDVVRWVLSPGADPGGAHALAEMARLDPDKPLRTSLWRRTLEAVLGEDRSAHPAGEDAVDLLQWILGLASPDALSNAFQRDEHFLCQVVQTMVRSGWDAILPSLHVVTQRAQIMQKLFGGGDTGANTGGHTNHLDLRSLWNRLLDVACEGGSYTIFCWLARRRCMASQPLLMNAAGQGHLRLFQKLSNVAREAPEAMLRLVQGHSAGAQSNRRLVAWYADPLSHHVFVAAVQHNQVHMLEHLTALLPQQREEEEEAQFQFQDAVTNQAATHNHRFGRGQNLANLSAEHGSLDCLRFLMYHPTHFPAPTGDGMNACSANGHLACVEFLHRHWSDAVSGCGTNAVDRAAAGGHTDCVRFLVNHRTELCTNHAFTQAAANGHLPVLEFLCANVPPEIARPDELSVVVTTRATNASCAKILDFFLSTDPELVYRSRVWQTDITAESRRAILSRLAESGIRVTQRNGAANGDDDDDNDEDDDDDDAFLDISNMRRRLQV